MTKRQAGLAAWIGRIAACACALLAFAAPASAEQSRAVIAVSAVVAPSCHVARAGEQRLSAQIACSSGTSFSMATVSSRDEKPLDEAAAILGAPARSGRGIAFAAPVRPAGPDADEPAQGSATRYLTVTY